MLGVNLADGEYKLDLLIVTDDYKDFLRKYALRIIYALQHLYTDYRADIRRMYDAQLVPPDANYSCKKLVFMTWGVEKWTKTKINRWLGLSPVKSINDRYILTMTEDLYRTKLPDASGEKIEDFISQNQLKVNNLDNLDKWWPQMVGFLFNVPLPLNPRYKCFIREMPDYDPSLRSSETVKSCIEYYNIREKDCRVSTWKGCNVVLSSNNFPAENAEEDEDTLVYICNRLKATENTRRQYNKEHMLAGLLRLYSKTGVVKAPLNERIITCAGRALSYTRSCATPAFKFLTKHSCVQLPFIFLSFLMCVFGTGLPFWQGIHVDSKTDDIWSTSIFGRYIAFGLFKVCINDGLGFKGHLQYCNEYSFNMPTWWRMLQVFCFLTTALYLVAFVLIVYAYCSDRDRTNTRLVATACHLTAGLLCISILLIWLLLGVDYITSILHLYADETSWYVTSNTMHASFYLFVVSGLSFVIWISARWCIECS